MHGHMNGKLEYCLEITGFWINICKSEHCISFCIFFLPYVTSLNLVNMVTTSNFQKGTSSWIICCSGRAFLKMKLKVKFGCLQNVCSFTMNGITFHTNCLVAVKVVGLWVYSCACMGTWTLMHMMNFVMKLKLWACWVGTNGDSKGMSQAVVSGEEENVTLRLGSIT